MTASLLRARAAGNLEVLLAIPSAAAIQVIVRDWWSDKSFNTTGLAADDEGPAG